jgi:hypothetical protein
MAAAAGRLASIRRRRWLLRAAAFAAAAAVLLSWGIWANRGQLGATNHSEQSSPLAVGPTTPVSTVTDIVDILRLARDVRDHRTVDAKFDLNADGSITQSDLDLLALRLVSLPLEDAAAPRKGGAS